MDTLPLSAEDELICRVKAALTEFGYSEAVVYWDAGRLLNPQVEVQRMDGTIWGRYHKKILSTPPPAVAWMAVELAGVNPPCWPCASGDDNGADCFDGRCRHPDADRWPPRELLVRGPR